MTCTVQPYRSGSDQHRMIELAQRYASSHPHVVDLPYRLSSWALDSPDNVAFWVEEGGKLLAWAVMQSPFWAVDYVCPPDDASLLAKILTWAGQRARVLLHTAFGRPSWFVHLLADQPASIKILEKAGFTCQESTGENSWSKVLMERAGPTALPQALPPAGFALRPLAGDAEAAAYVELHQAAFESRNMTLEWRLRTLRHPDYRSLLDLIAVAPDGQLAAFCVGWLQSRVHGDIVGQIEPMGVAKEWRQLGLGKAILVEVLDRLQVMDAYRVFVETDDQRDAALALYESVGFRRTKKVLVYRKDYGHDGSK